MLFREIILKNEPSLREIIETKPMLVYPWVNSHNFCWLLDKLCSKVFNFSPLPLLFSYIGLFTPSEKKAGRVLMSEFKASGTGTRTRLGCQATHIANASASACSATPPPWCCKLIEERESKSALTPIEHMRWSNRYPDFFAWPWTTYPDRKMMLKGAPTTWLVNGAGAREVKGGLTR